MKNYKITTLKSNKSISIIRPISSFPSYLMLELSLQSQEALGNFEWGFVDLYYQTLDGFPECKRIILSYQDFLEKGYRYYINCGEYVYKIRVGSFFFYSDATRYRLNVKLKNSEEVHIDKSIRLKDLHEAIMFGPSIDFLEKLRAFPPRIFFDVISNELNNLEARIDEASGRAFNYSSLLDTIVKKSIALADSKLELNLVGIIYSLSIAANKSKIELMFPNLAINFDSWRNNDDGTGHAKIWIEPKEKVLFNPTFKLPFEKIEIEGILLIIEICKDKSTDDHFIFKIYGILNPEEWQGGSSLNLQPYNKNVITGYNRILKIGSNNLSTGLLEHIRDNLIAYFLKSFNFYFSHSQTFESNC